MVAEDYIFRNLAAPDDATNLELGKHVLCHWLQTSINLKGAVSVLRSASFLYHSDGSAVSIELYHRVIGPVNQEVGGVCERAALQSLGGGG